MTLSVSGRSTGLALLVHALVAWALDRVATADSLTRAGLIGACVGAFFVVLLFLARRSWQRFVAGLARRIATQQGARRPDRRAFPDRFKADVVRQVHDELRRMGRVSRELESELTPTDVAYPVKRARADRTGRRAELTTVEREELARLRNENRVLREERDILKRRRPFSRS
jgi:transposase